MMSVDILGEIGAGIRDKWESFPRNDYYEVVAAEHICVQKVEGAKGYGARSGVAANA